jgi:hypothetical protein
MKIKHSNKNQVNIKIYDLQFMEPIDVTIKNILPGVSQIDFYHIDKYYSATWAAMKTDIISFVISINDEFLSKNSGGPKKLIDDDVEALRTIQKTASKVHGEHHEITLELNNFSADEISTARNRISKEMLSYLNEDDYLEKLFPTKVNPEWDAFCQITKTLRDGLIKYKTDIAT